MRVARHFALADRAQSLVEFALAVPLLLLLLLGVVDLGRAYVYKTAVVNAAREAAMYAAKEPNATSAQVTQKAWNESGFGDWNSSWPSAFALTLTRTGDVSVQVTYTFPLVSGHLYERLFGTDRLTVGATANFPSLSN